MDIICDPVQSAFDALNLGDSCGVANDAVDEICKSIVNAIDFFGFDRASTTCPDLQICGKTITEFSECK